MGKYALYALRFFMVLACTGIITGSAHAQASNGNGKTGIKNNVAKPAFTVDGTVALASLITIGDGHLVKIVDEFTAMATREEVIAGDWEKIKELLRTTAAHNVPSLMWFALPSGEYSTVEKDRVEANLISRPYFQRVLGGETVIGELVVGKSTGKNVAVVAVPVFKEKEVVGVLGCSVYLDKLSDQIKHEMALPPNIIFYSFNSKPLMALDWDQKLIFRDPRDLGEEVDRAFSEMLKHEQGTVTYTFRGKPRTVLYKKSPITNWWYGLGIAQNETGKGR